MTKSYSVGVHEAKTHLSRLLERVRTGEEIVIERRGEPIARLIGIGDQQRPRFGTAHGEVKVHDDFDAPLPDGLADALGA